MDWIQVTKRRVQWWAPEHDNQTSDSVKATKDPAPPW